jgi:PAS domain S-box-containing protein
MAAFILWGPECFCLYNDAAAEIVGDGHPALLGERFPVVCPELWGLVKEAAETDETTGTSPTPGGNVVSFRRDGSARAVGCRVTGAPLRDASERRVGAIVWIMTLPQAPQPVADGVVERAASHPANQAPRSSGRPAPEGRAGGDTLLGSLPAAIYSCDAMGRITQFNDAAVELWGRTPKIGHDLWCGSWRIYRPDGTQLPVDQCPMAVALHEGREVRGEEIVVERPDGVRRRVLPYPQPIRDSAGRVVGALNLLVDVTDLKLAEAQLAETREDLAIQVAALERLHALSIELAGSHATQDALLAILATVVELHAGDMGLLTLYDDATGCLDVAASVGFSADLLAELKGMKPGPMNGTCGAAFAARQRAVAEDVRNDPRFEGLRDFARRAGFRAVHSTPVLTRDGRILGVLAVQFRTPRTPVPREIQLADMCARHVAQTLEFSRTERALRDSEQRFAAFMEHLPGAAWIKDADGRYLYANPECGRIFPVATPQALNGKNDFDIFPAETARQFQENDRRVLDTGRAVQAVELLRQRDGEVHHSIVNKFPMPGPDGRSPLVGGIAFDITVRVKAEQALRESESKFRAVAMNAPVAIFIKDLDGRYTLANRLACARLQHPEGVVGMTDHELMPAGQAEAIRRRDLEVIATGGPVSCEDCFGAGELERKFLSVKFPVTDAQGMTVGVGGVAIDITDRDRAEEQSREAAALLEGSLDALTGHIAILDHTGAIIKVNEAWRRFAAKNGFAGDSFGVGANYLDACTPHAGPATGCTIEAAYAVQGIKDVMEGSLPVFILEYPCHSPSEKRWFIMRVTRFGAGDRLRLVVAHEDVSERRAVEQIIVRNAERLRLANEAANLGTWEFDPRTRRVSWDARGRELFGNAGTDDLSYEEALARVHPEDRHAVIAAVERALDPAGDGRYEMEYRVVGFPDGGERWHRANGQASFEDGRPSRFMGTLQDITDRKRAEEALRRNEEMLRLATDAAGVGTWTRDLATDVTRWSPQLEEIFGLPRGGFPGRRRDFLDLVHPDDRERHEREVAAAIAERRDYEVEFRYRHATGEYRWMVGRGRAWYDSAGRPVLVAGTGQDITARKQAESALQRSEEQFRSLANSIPQLAWTARPDGHITWYNQRWYEYTGATFEQMEGWGWQSVHDPAELPRVVRRFKDALAEGKTWEDTFPLRRHDGEMRWHLSRALPLRDENGRIVRWFGTNTDITAQREAEESLRASEERFRLLADASPALIWISGTDKLGTWFNKAWLEFTGRPMEEELGAGWTDRLHPDDRARVLENYSAAFDARREFRMEYRLRRRDNVYRWVFDHGIPLYGAGARFAGYIGSCYDMTDQVLARQTLERQQTLLEEAVRARTAELQESNERLRLAERMASLGTLSAGLGHDMGNLLVPVRIRLESLTRADLAPELQEDVEAIRTAAEYLQRLANGLRMLAIDPARTPRAESTDIGAWWADAGPLLKNSLPRSIAMRASLPEQPCRVAMSKAALTQTVFNLVQNAGDAMRARGHGAVTVAVECDDATVTVRVSDDGPGMSPEVRARCMEPFFSTKPRSISTGLGLLLVYGLVRDSGGSIDLTSEPGVGTTFLITLPRDTGNADRPVSPKTVSVNLRDDRLRAIVTAELKALAFRIVPPDAADPLPDVLITDSDAPRPQGSEPRHLVLFADLPASAGKAVTLGAKPKLHAIRLALRRLARGES